MANKIFLRVGAWYKASAKLHPDDIELSELIDDVDARFPEVEIPTSEGSDEGGGTLQEAIDAGAVLDKDNTIDGGGFTVDINNATLLNLMGENADSSYANLYLDANTANSPDGGFYVSDAAGTSYTNLNVTPTEATIEKSGAGAKEIATVNYLVYTALLSQEGTDAPIPTILGDNTVGNIVWTRGSAGNFVGTLSNAFAANKTLVMITPTIEAYSIYVESPTVSTILIKTTDAASFAYADNILFNTPIEIRVYP